MSNRGKGPRNTNCPDRQVMPKAVVHKKILNTARDRPEASIKQLASDVMGASEQLVEQTLDKYGDPASDEGEIETEDGEVTGDITDGRNYTQTGNAKATGNKKMDSTNSTESTESTADSPKDTTCSFDNSSKSSSDSIENFDEKSNEIESTETEKSKKASEEISFEELSEKQQQIIHAIREQPHATQSELAEVFDVSRATISQRVNAIDNFDWSKRKEIVCSLFEGENGVEGSTEHSLSFTHLSTRIEELSSRIEKLEEALEHLNNSNSTPFNDPETAAAVVRACIDSECVDDEKEQEIIVEIIQNK